MDSTLSAMARLFSLALVPISISFSFCFFLLLGPTLPLSPFLFFLGLSCSSYLLTAVSPASC